MLVDSIITFFCGIFQEKDDKADFVDFVDEGIAEIVQLNLNIVYQVLYVFVVHFAGVDSRLLWLLRRVR